MNSKGESRLLHGASVSSRMLPSDANIHGNVHGGVILNLIEEAGAVLTTRYCNYPATTENGTKKVPCVTALARIERMDFVAPMHIGELAEVQGKILYTSSHSLEVQVSVTSEDIIQSKRRLISRARLWYVPLSLVDVDKITRVPTMSYSNDEEEQRGRSAYEKQRADRMRKASEPCLTALLANGLDNMVHGMADGTRRHTVKHSRSYLSFVVGANDVTSLGDCRGGVLLRHMDECAGIVAGRHTKGACVTASVDAINFHKKIKQGSLVTVIGQATFTSSRSLEIEVIVEIESYRGEDDSRERAVDSFFTFVSIDAEGKARNVPQLLRENTLEEKRFQSGERRYFKRKEERKNNPD